MITGVHAIFYSTDADADRAFLRDVLRLPQYYAMPGWPMFQAPGEIACHPADAPSHGITFSCDDLEATVADLKSHGVTVTDIVEAAWGWSTYFEMPGGGSVQLYQPKYERPS
jgi:catechol 2,3-dioxygenase-like lactoylglutathione lyase family enzyme